MPDRALTPAEARPLALATDADGGARLLTAEDLAARWQVPKAHVYRLGREGAVPMVKLGRYQRFRLDAIEAFEHDGGTAGDA